jgi:ArsR family transcriptional regulator
MFADIDEAQMKPEQISAMRVAADSACALLKAIGNRDRLMLLCQMIDGEKSVGEFEELLDIRQPTLSQQLGVLRSEGVVETRRDGKRIYYRLASREAETLLNTLYGLFCPATLPEAKVRASGRPARRTK